MSEQIITTCDCCGKTIPDPRGDGHGAWKIALTFVSWWNQEGDVREIILCGEGCGSRAARLLGFEYDTGKILSIARKEMIDSVTVCGPHGGGMGDIAIGGVAGASAPMWHAQVENVPLAAAMKRECDCCGEKIDDPKGKKPTITHISNNKQGTYLARRRMRRAPTPDPTPWVYYDR